MKISKQQIKDFVENHLSEKNIASSSQTLSIHRGYFFTLCYIYSTDVINTIELCKFLKIKSHGTVLNGMKNVKDGIKYDKRIKYEWGNLEEEFIKKFKPEPVFIDASKLSNLQIKRRLLNKEVKIKNLSNNLNHYKKKCEKIQTILSEKIKNKQL